MHRHITPLIATILLILSMSFETAPIQAHKRAKRVAIMSYNVENLFDTIDDKHTHDDEFTPLGAKQWDSSRYYEKLRHIAEVISRTGGQYWPSIIGLIEVEHGAVVEDLLRYTCLRDRGYKFAITHSLDPRGIDVAVLYRTQDVELSYRAEHQVHFEHRPSKRSRNILELGFALANGDSLQLLLAHWPSRREGVRESEELRCAVADKMRNLCDSLYNSLSGEERKHRHFVLMGDFNEETHERGIKQGLQASARLESEPPTSLSAELKLYSLMNPTSEEQRSPQPPGSYCYQGRWTQLDHFVISESLLLSDARSRYKRGSARTYYAPFLASKHQVGAYRSPYRSYGGNHYLGGYSDHYPIVLQLELYNID